MLPIITYPEGDFKYVRGFAAPLMSFTFDNRKCLSADGRELRGSLKKCANASGIDYPFEIINFRNIIWKSRRWITRRKLNSARKERRRIGRTEVTYARISMINVFEIQSKIDAEICIEAAWKGLIEDTYEIHAKISCGYTKQVKPGRLRARISSQVYR